MIKRMLLCAVLSLGVTLGGCASTGSTSTGSIDPTVASVIEAVKQGCSYVAPATQVASIITTFTGGAGVVDLIGTVANSICGAVTAKASSRSAGPPQVNGVVLTGRFLASAKRHR